MQFYFFAFWGYHNYSTFVFYISLLSSFLSIFLLVSTMNGILSSIMSSNLFLFIFEGYFSCMSILYPLYWRYSQTMSSSLPPSTNKFLRLGSSYLCTNGFRCVHHAVNILVQQVVSCIPMCFMGVSAES